MHLHFQRRGSRSHFHYCPLLSASSILSTFAGGLKTFSHVGWEWGQVCSFKRRSDSCEEYAPSNFPKLGRNVSFSRNTWDVWGRLPVPWGQRRASGRARAAMLCVGYYLSVDKGPFRGFDSFTMLPLQSALISCSHFIFKGAFKNLLWISRLLLKFRGWILNTLSFSHIRKI